MTIRFLASLALLMALAGPAAAQTPRLTVVEGQGRVVSLPREASSLFVGDPGVADVQAVSGRSFYLGGVAPGTTNLFALDFEDNLIVGYTVQVLANNDPAAASIRDGAPGGNLGVNASGNVAILRGQANTLEEALAALDARRILDGAGRTAIDRTRLAGGTQVSLRVRFVEASRRSLQQIGFNLSALGTEDPLRILTGTGNAADFVRGGGALGNNALVAGIGGDVGGIQIDAVLTALERQGLVEILSEPVLTTTSGRRASFEAGGEFAIPVNQGDGVITPAYRSFGVSISFLPVVLPNGRIAIDVTPEVSFIDPEVGVSVDGFQAPSLSVRRAQTNVEVGSGQTFAIAGLYEQIASDTVTGLPGTTRRPLLRGLFGSSATRRDERELVIFITPTLAEASDATAPNRRIAPDVVDTIGFIVK